MLLMIVLLPLPASDSVKTFPRACQSVGRLPAYPPHVVKRYDWRSCQDLAQAFRCFWQHRGGVLESDGINQFPHEAGGRAGSGMCSTHSMQLCLIAWSLMLLTLRINDPFESHFLFEAMRRFMEQARKQSETHPIP